MTHFEKITGSAITELFDTLILHKTPLKLTLIDTGYENLTRIVNLTDRNKKPHFVIDMPDGFEKAAPDVDVWHILFEFSGRDKIKYAFTAKNGEIVDNQIFIELPQELERRQRREVFRIDAPPGTRLCFTADAQQLELEVLNISIGGSLAAWVQTEADMSKHSPLAAAQMLEDVALVFPAEIMPRPIKVDSVQIKRIECDSEIQRFEAGLEFCHISKHEQKRLTDLIYKLQRQYLRHRLPLDL